ncbi:hypothetical protein LK09_08005 [Microbacterium mangrovi]|uniref:EthD domain-containing protein n=1 Tax=Microbacterium mangrovi TaxID=1348253 RepID=A0A0B2AB61_9MICO|nr:hypothetical protein LK09_08005 [Microbacterium mangrovi]
MSGVLVVLTEPVEGAEADFEHWYENVHVPDLLRLPSVLSVRRFALNAKTGNGTGQRYLAVYEVTDTTQAEQEVTRAGETGQMPISASLDGSNVQMGYFDLISAH